MCGAARSELGAVGPIRAEGSRWARELRDRSGGLGSRSCKRPGCGGRPACWIWSGVGGEFLPPQLVSPGLRRGLEAQAETREAAALPRGHPNHPLGGEVSAGP
ncbi:hypothetical protein NDU88_006857 [Pleurodeles waltl]|uniref:Uncharacterized protein n=1 Tax=Pleurodeles waltl TaxID=8319 RepID=A0AAV7WYR7_PLEWA|nr:hypothetical protein NDU88_006857 [Pleurodeles waltl]